MKEFSAGLATDRKFEVGGVILEWRYPFFEELADVYAADQANGDVDPTSVDQLRSLYHKRIEQIEVFLTQESADKWRELANRRDDPLPPFMIAEVFQWLQEVASGRPTLSPSGSEPGGGNTALSLPDGSPSTEETSTR